MKVPLVALATSSHPDSQLDEDLAPLSQSIRELGAIPIPVPWDSGADWGRYDAVLVKSTWDYPFRKDDFSAWARAVDEATRLHNPLSMIEWNLDKRYLAEMAADGVNTVPTQWIHPGQTYTLPTDTAYVIKPIVSCAARDTACYRPESESKRAIAHIERLHREHRGVMIQPYQHAIDTHGEISLIYVDGIFSHAFRKTALLRPGADCEDGLFFSADFTPHRPSVAEMNCAEQTLKSVSVRHGKSLYARIDMVCNQVDEPVLMECELIEPLLLFRYNESAPRALATALLRRCRTWRE
ncbi:hypothetical protein [Streptomyces sp. NPDC048266]|uniref:hypothetical protein n=1 Tax=Streptomyces sp. NPDC048266 TaxID=3155787 RepID=UPI0033C7274E